MNGAEIHWLKDALLLTGGMFAFIVIVVGWSACHLSGRISRDEEARELRNALTDLDRAA